jgi:pimeloyl-ACP methyl ester carboxylesterase
VSDQAHCNGIDIAYDDAGLGTPPIVLVHGGAFCDRRYMRPLFTHFSEHHRVIAPDLRGHGESQRIGPISNEQFADDLAALCAELAIESPVIVGHSTGGHAALELAGRHPEVPSALVLLDIGPLEWAPAQQQENRGLTALLRGESGHGVLKHVAAAMLPESEPFPGRTELIDDVGSASPDVFAELIESDLVWDARAAAERVPASTPTLLIASDHPLLDLDEFRVHCAHALIARTVGSGHFHQLVVPDQIISMVERFLNLNELALEPAPER